MMALAYAALAGIPALVFVPEGQVALGKRPGAVKSLQHRAMASLRRVLTDEGA